MLTEREGGKEVEVIPAASTGVMLRQGRCFLARNLSSTRPVGEGRERGSGLGYVQLVMDGRGGVKLKWYLLLLQS